MLTLHNCALRTAHRAWLSCRERKGNTLIELGRNAGNSCEESANIPYAVSLTVSSQKAMHCASRSIALLAPRSHQQAPHVTLSVTFENCINISLKRLCTTLSHNKPLFVPKRSSRAVTPRSPLRDYYPPCPTLLLDTAMETCKVSSPLASRVFRHCFVFYHCFSSPAILVLSCSSRHLTNHDSADFLIRYNQL